MQEKDYIDGHWIYDLETFPNVATMTIIRADGKEMRQFEISDRKNDSDRLATCLRYMVKHKQKLVGFNNNGFDYPVLHDIILHFAEQKKEGKPLNISAKKIYRFAQDQIQSFKGEFGRTIKSEDQYIYQIDLFKVWHFDNKARSTSLKMLEVNMKSDNVEDLPFEVGTVLKPHEIDILLKYNLHDVKETLKFYKHSLSALRMREDLSKKYDMDFTNFNDTKIGKEYFIMQLEKFIPGSCYTYTEKGRKVNQTPRRFIRLKECLFDYYNFTRPEFIAVKDWFERQVISETKGVLSDIDEASLGEVAKYASLTTKKKRFKGKPSQSDIDTFKNEHPLGWVEEEELKATEYLLDAEGNFVYETVIDAKGKEKQKKVRVPKKSYWACWRIAETLNVVINGFQFDFGTGGIHGSISNAVFHSNEKTMLVDKDVASFYPNLSIKNRVYPEHLTEKFCDIYEDIYNQRKRYPKGSPENAVMKLALNGSYGESNNKFSCFYDPKFTMTITVGGQLTLCLLVDMMMQNCNSFKMIMANTDGITYSIDRGEYEKSEEVCKEWMRITKLELEEARYSKMCIRDVNSYLAVYEE